MTAEYRVFGPPGTGKTTFLTKQINRAVEKHGPNSIIIASFTKTAARELLGRDLPVGKERCNTLHSLCFRALGNPTLAETKINEFNEDYPQFQLSDRSGINTDDGEMRYGGSKTPHDDNYADMQLARAKCIPADMWPLRLQNIGNAWKKFKQSKGYYDFNDIIEVAATEGIALPEGTHIGIFDEVQDFSPLQLKAVRKISEQLSYSILAGDDDQTIFSFTGADPQAFLNPPLPEENIRILGQSYRVPREVQRVAENWIKRVSLRKEKQYLPRDVEGGVYKVQDGSREQPEEIVYRAMAGEEKGRTSMILATCGYMLNETISLLRKLGAPFHNPYKITRGDWNPLASRSAAIMTKDRLVAYLDPTGPGVGNNRLWSIPELAAWIELIKVGGIFNRGAKEEIKRIAEAQKEITQEQYAQYYTKWFTRDGLNEAMQLQPAFIENRIVKAKEQAVLFPFKVFETRGLEALRATPKICVGTIHSVKGGQADDVYLFPDLSTNAKQSLNSREGMDAVIRQFYVGLTRCRERLYITADDSKMGVDIPV